MVIPVDLDDIRHKAEILLRLIAHGPSGAIRAALQPEPADFDTLFVGEAARRAREGYVSLWANPPTTLAKPDQTDLRVSVVRSEDLDRASEFPGGYRKIANLLVPGFAWCAFKCVAPGASRGMAYDGLVWRDDHWAWFPKPWRVLSTDLSDLS